MKTWATGVDSLGGTRQITVGDIWEKMNDDRIHCEIVSFNGQWFEVETIDCNTGFRQNARIQDFNEFVNNWQVFSYGTPPNELLTKDCTMTMTLTMPQMPSCKCGAHKLGVKDFAKGHSTWCDVYKL